MAPWQVFVILVFWGIPIFAGYHVGKYKGQTSTGVILTIILGLLGLIIVACLPRSDEAKVAAAQRQYAIQAEAARRAGYPWPPQQPYPTYPPYPPQGQQPYPPFRPPVQQPYPQQPPLGQWQQPPPGSGEPSPPAPWSAPPE